MVAHWVLCLVARSECLQVVEMVAKMETNLAEKMDLR